MVWLISSCCPTIWNDLNRSDHSVWYRHSSYGIYIFLIVYIDDIVIAGDDYEGIAQLKQYLSSHFQFTLRLRFGQVEILYGH